MGKSLLKLLFVLLLVGTVQTVYAQEPYAVLSENNTVLTFYYDGDKVSKNGYGIGPFELNDTRWGGNSSNITKVVFDSSFKNCTSITSTAYWFFGCYYLATIEGIDNLKTGNVVDMTAMFADCRSLTSLTLWNFDTSNVTNMSSMFQDCSGLVSLTLEWEHTEKVTDMSCMFRGCKKIGSLKLTHFNTKNVTNMWCMFYDCTELTVLDIYYFDTSNVTNMNSMFQDCPNLIDIDLRGFNTEKVTNMGQMFDGCSKLKKLDMSKFNTQNVTNFQCLFMNCSELTTLDLSTFNTAQVEHMGQVFEGCSKLQTIYVDKDKWTTSAVTFGPRMFDGCTSLIGGAGTAYNAEQIDYTYARIDGGTDNPGYLTDKNATPSPGGDPEPYAVLTDNDDEITTGEGTIKGKTLTFYYDANKGTTGMSVGPFSEYSDIEWFNQCESITKVVFDASFAECTSLTSTAKWFYGFSNLKTITGISNLNTSNVTNMSWMFFYCSSLTSLDITSFKTGNVENMNAMFYGCTGLTSLDLSSFDTSSLKSLFGMFQDCTGLKSINLTNFKTDKVENMGQLFLNCSSLESLDVTGFKTDKATSMFNMFRDCSSLKSLDLSSFNTKSVDNMFLMFRGCSNLTTIFVGSDWSTVSVTQSTGMFEDCTALVGGSGTKYDANHIDKAYARIDGGSGNPGYLTDKNATIILCPDNNHPHVIDLGLPSGTKWACCNIGASEPSAFGNQYAWGETETKSKYTWETYIYCNGTKETCQDIGTNIARTEYDVAHVKWGGSYQIPSVDDIKELIDNCTKRSVTYEGIYYTGPNGNTIFVPSRMYGWSDETGNHGAYWTSDLSDELHIAMNWFVWESVYPAKWNNNGRESGFFVRPVAKGGGESPAEETEEVIKITSAGQTTWCSASDLDFTGVEGLKAYIAPGYNRTTGTIWLMRVFEVPANEGILLIGDPGEYKVPKKSTTTYYENMFVGTLKAITINETEGEYTNYYLSNGTSGVGFYKVDGTQKIGANRAYLPLLKGTTQSGTRFIGIDFGDGTTSVKEVKSGEVKGEKWFTLQGQRVTKPAKGLYIKNGKKVIVR